MIKDSRDMFINDHIQEEDIMTCLVDKIIDGISMFLFEPAPSLAGVGLKLASTFIIVKVEEEAVTSLSPFLESILNTSNRFKRQELLEHANAD